MKNSYDIKTTTIVDKNNNRIIYQDKYNRVQVYQKAIGYNLVYMDDLKEILLKLNSGKVSYILLDILTTLVDRNFEVKLDYKILAKLYKLSEGYSRKIITEFKKLDVFRAKKGYKGVYNANPFLVIPQRTKDEVVYSKQLSWDIEYYDWYKYSKSK